MPVSPTYPGVYVQELPSGSRTIVGVSTSITAFVGRALRGLTDEPVYVSSFGEFGRKFGGLWAKSAMSYAVQQYFLAGGKEALIVRVASASAEQASVGLDLENVLYLRGKDSSVAYAYAITGASSDEFELAVTPTPGTAASYTAVMDDIDLFPGDVGEGPLIEILSVPTGRPTNTTGTFSTDTNGYKYASIPGTGSADTVAIRAISPGTWGNKLYITVDYDTSDSTDPTLFNFKVQELDAEGNEVQSEVYRNVSMDPLGSRYLPTLLEEESDLVEMDAKPYQRPAATDDPVPLTGGTDGGDITVTEIVGQKAVEPFTGMYALERADIFNLLCLPPPTLNDGSNIDLGTWGTALEYCEDRRAICIVDGPDSWDSATAAYDDVSSTSALTSSYGALYFPRVRIADPLQENRLRAFAPCGVVAGLIAKTDGQRGIWKAPAGLDARAPIVRGLSVKLTDTENGRLNPLGLNCFRTFPSVGTVLWGARTMDGNDRLSSDWKYLPVRRLALYIEESLYRGLQWAVFEPNDEPLWGQIRLSAGGFMHQLFRQGAFKGSTPKDAYFVKCDSETTTDGDVDRGIVNVLIGFAPLKPAEFVILSIQQIAGQVSA